MTLLRPRLPDSSAPLVKWGKLHGAAPALAIAEASREAPGPLLVIAPNSREAESLCDEIGFFAGAAVSVKAFPDLETLPYDSFSAHPDITSARLAVLAELPRARAGVWVVAIDTLLQRLAPRSYIEGYSLKLQVGEIAGSGRLAGPIDGGRLCGRHAGRRPWGIRGARLLARRVSRWARSSRYASICLIGTSTAFGYFDPDTQRSGDKLERVDLLPARETPLNPDAVREFRRRYRLRFAGDLTEQVDLPRREPGHRIRRHRVFPAAVLRANLASIRVPAAAAAYSSTSTMRPPPAEALWNGIAARHEQLRHDRHRPILDPPELYLPPAEFRERVRRVAAASSCDHSSGRPKPAGRCRISRPRMPSTVRIDARADAAGRGARRPSRREEPRECCSPPNPRADANCCSTCCAAAASSRRYYENFASFIASDRELGIAVSPRSSAVCGSSPRRSKSSPKSQLFGDRARQERRRRRAERDPAKILKELSDLRIGAPVVHESYGVGRYVGLQTMDVAGYTGEFLVLEYADGDKLYVPVQALHLVSRYTGAPAETAPLHKLGGEQWQKARRKAAQRIRDVAAELLDLYSRRAAREGTHAAPARRNIAPFKPDFPFEETADQATAIDQVHRRFEVGQTDGPRHLRRRRLRQDRGGAARRVRRGAGGQAGGGAGADDAARPAALHDLQDRFADWPVRIESLSRFRTNKEAGAVIDGIASGAVDIVIATQRLLQGKVRFKDLGLVVIDEEHRFGVRDKEKLKALRAEVDVLTLTATPDSAHAQHGAWADCGTCP